MRCRWISLAGALGVLLLGLGPQAQAQFVRNGPRVTGHPTSPVAPAPVPAPPPPPPPPPADTPSASAAPASSGPPPIDGALPGGVLGLGDEGVGALIRPADAPGPLASSSTSDAARAGVVSDAPGGSTDATPAARHRRLARRRRSRSRRNDR
jgi:hypothetical protein